jgi:signal recognition particle GTPase
MQTNQNLMSELSKSKTVVKPDLTILTVDSLRAMMRCNSGGIQQVRRH